jgi:hypothetical protein
VRSAAASANARRFSARLADGEIALIRDTES